MAREIDGREKNVFGYLTHEFETFDQRPLGDVDSLILACLSYFQLPAEAEAARTEEGMDLRDLFRAEWLEGMTGGLWGPAGLSRLLACVAASPRMRGIRLSCYVEDLDAAREKQFSACTLRLPGGDAYVSFRGTDNTLVGWKEDFNMAFERDVPSQVSARAYLERVAPTISGRIYVGGHSKGGNLAAYVASTCSPEVAGRLERVFSHDGPGFTAESLAASSWRERARLVSKTVPRSSLIGMLFEQQEEYSVVDSSTVGILQHDPFSWVVEGCDFVRVKGIARGAAALDETLNQWISSMTVEEREGFVNTLFSVLYASGEDTFASMAGNLQTTLPAMLDSLAATDPEERRYLTRAVSLLLRAFVPEVSLPEVTLPEVALPESLAALQSEGTALLARAWARAEGAVGADATQVAGTSGATDDA